MSSALPRIRLRPKSDPKPIRHGAPWVYANQLVLDRRSKAIPSGSFAVLEDADRTPLRLVAVNAASKIAARVMDGPEATIDATWIEARITRALNHRSALFDTPFYRLIHAEADGLPGVIVDRFGHAAVIQPNAAWADVHLPMLVQTLQKAGMTTLYKNASGRARSLEGLDDASAFVSGTLDAPVQVQMNDATYLADITGGQKTGLFYDQRPNHSFAAQLAKGGSVLDVFSHVGGFSLAALAKGATRALAIDASQAALDLAQHGADFTGFGDRFTTQRADAFDALTALGEDQQTFDTVICDPPAFAPAKPALDAGLRAYERLARLAAPLVAPGGYLVLCSCSHAADLSRFRQASIRGIGRAGRPAQIVYTGGAGPDHPQHPHLAESSYLKALAFRMLT
ncbi:MAG: class I SAM-dependent rRNA methyltransferase [Pseudomonadota bacterium]